MKSKKSSTDILGDLLKKISSADQEEINYKMNLAAKIYWGMKAKGWNQNDFAEQMGKKISVISRWLSGYHNFESDTLFAIQSKLGICLLNIDNPSSNPLLTIGMGSSLTISGGEENLMTNGKEFMVSGDFTRETVTGPKRQSFEVRRN